MKKAAFIIINLALLFAHCGVMHAQCFDNGDKMKAMYIYNFAKYIEWPQHEDLEN